ncbi:MAG: AAA family ATPase, partial [Bacteroidota bacterium]
MLETFEIKNYRSCVSTKIDIHPNLTVLIGTNGAGKSNILSAVKIFSTIDRVRPSFMGLLEDGIENKTNINVKLILTEKNKIEASIKSTLIHSQDERNNDDVQSVDIKYRVDKFESRGYKDADQEIIEFSSFLRRTRLSSDLPKRFKSKENQMLLSILRELQDVSYYGASLFTDPSECPTAIDLERFGMSSRRKNSAKTPEQFLYDLYKEHRKDSDIFSQYLYTVGENGVGLIDDIQFVDQELPSSSHKVGAGGKVITTKKINRIIIPYFVVDGIALSPNQLSDGTFKTLALVFYILCDKNKLL